MSGVHSFDFLGLGYRVDWPVSIILTTSALKIYSDIFNYLIQVKLAVFALNDVWRLLKVLIFSYLCVCVCLLECLIFLPIISETL